MKTKPVTPLKTGWIAQWMQSVANDEYTMNQCKTSSVYKKNCSLEDVVAEAKKYNIHLLLLKDDKGEEIIAASKDEFTVLC